MAVPKPRELDYTCMAACKQTDHRKTTQVQSHNDNFRQFRRRKMSNSMVSPFSGSKYTDRL